MFSRIKSLNQTSLRFGHKTRNGNLERQGLGTLGKFATHLNPTCLEVGFSPKLRDELECRSFTKCVVFMCSVGV
jgi:hypothetical protein